MAGREPLTVSVPADGCDVVVSHHGFRGLGAALARVAPSPRAVLVTDAEVGPRWAEPLRAELADAGIAASTITIPSGEAHKHVGTWTTIVDGALAAGLDRGTPIVALGGGVVGDLAGFAGATLLRGVPVVQVPTTLLAMVDSSVGGKTGFDHALGKNLVGAFHPPVLVWAALDTLSTLPPGEWRSGLGEVVKTALVADATLWDRLVDDPAGTVSGDALAATVAACVGAKAAIVAADPRESGLRACLNAGHTVGHALEVVAGFGTLPHGVAVGHGLVAETAWAEREGLVERPGLAAAIADVLGRLGWGPPPSGLDRGALVAAMRLDKKTRGDRITVPVVVRPGSARLLPLPTARLAELLP